MTYLGMDVGGSAVKLAIIKNGQVKKLYACEMPGVMSGKATLAELTKTFSRQLRIFLRKNRVRAKNCALSLPQDLTFIRRITVPWMTTKQLLLNLPFEFHDYIPKDKDLYYYDYSVIKTVVDDTGKPAKLDLLVAAVPKDAIALWRSVLKKAGLKLVVAVPEYLTYRNLITAHKSALGEESARVKEYCVVDMGADFIRVHMYRGNAYETTRVIDYGGASVAEVKQKDDDASAQQQLRDRYSGIAVEILRAINFYRFNTPDSSLEDIYFCGGLALDAALMNAVSATVNLNIHYISEIIPKLQLRQLDAALAVRCPAAIGAAFENGRR